jgi:hypothetical protein
MTPRAPHCVVLTRPLGICLQPKYLVQLIVLSLSLTGGLITGVRRALAEPLLSRTALQTAAPDTTKPQKKSVKLVGTYDWQYQDFEPGERAKSGELVRLKVTGLNLLCYDYQITVNQFSSPKTEINVLGQLRTLAGPEVAKPDTTQLEEAVEGEEGVVEVERVNPIEEVRDVQRGLSELSEKSEAAKRALRAFTVAVCGPRPGFTRAEKLKFWAATKDTLDAFTGSAGLLAQSQRQLEDALAELDRLEEQATRLKPQVRARLRAARRSARSLSGTTIPALQKDVQSIRELAPLVAAQLADEPVSRYVLLTQDTDSLRLAVVATGKTGIPEVTEKTVTDPPISISVTSRFRVFLSAGVLFSSLDEHDFERVNLPVVEIDTTQADSTYSTIIDKERNTEFAFAPAFLANISLGDWEGVSVLGSLGLAGRSVNGTLSPDFLAGGSVGVFDRALLTIAWHLGRVEQLLLDDPESVSERPVPTSIVLDTVVSERWRSGAALVLSFRL